MPLIDIIAGARPNFIKIAPIIKAIEESRKKGSSLIYRLIHTGQHYDKKMSDDFFAQLNIPEPDINLKVGSGSQAEQTGAIMIRYEEVLLKSKSDLCLVVGDVTSTMACAITAKKLNVPVAHVEGGIRSGDMTMPEEINRIVTDSISNWFFTTSCYANLNLKNIGVNDDNIFFVGNTMIDTLFANLDNLKKPPIWEKLGLESGEYFVLTLHRPNNVDDQDKLLSILNTIRNARNGKQLIFPVHPRTLAILKEIGGNLEGIHFLDPMGYLEFNYLVKNAFAVITDSGGITEEATVLKVPCMTLRSSTERPETVSIGTNELVDIDSEKILLKFKQLFDGEWKKGAVPEKWDGKSAQRIVAVLEKLKLSGY